MADKATSSYGLLIYSAADASSAPSDGSITTALGEIIDAKWSGIDVKAINATHLNQSDRGTRTKPGMFDPGTIDVKLQFDGTDVDTVRGYAYAGTFRWWLIKFPVADDITHFHTAKFRGWIKTFNPADAPAEGDAITTDLSIQIVGTVTWTPYVPS